MDGSMKTHAHLHSVDCLLWHLLVLLYDNETVNLKHEIFSLMKLFRDMLHWCDSLLANWFKRNCDLILYIH